MRLLPLTLCLSLVACNNGPVEHASTADDATRLGGKAASDFQLRVTGVCPAGQFAQSVGADGTVNCAVPDMSAADIIGVNTGSGSGLVGGSDMGEVSLALAVCPEGQLLKRDATGWSCADDLDSLAGKTCTMGQVLSFDGTAWNCADDADSFAGRTCAVGQVLKYNGTTWACAADDAPMMMSCPAGQLLKSNGTTWLCASDDTMNSMSCPAGQVLKSNGAGWLCAADEGVTGVSTLAGTGLVGGGAMGNLALALTPCGDGEVLKANDGGWACAADTVGLSALTLAANGGLTGGPSALSLTGCAAGEVLKSNGTGWACAVDTGLTAVTPATGGGLVGDATTLALAGCASGEVLKSNGTGWACAADTVGTGDLTGVLTNAGSGLVGGATSGDATLALASCPNGEVLKSSGAGWACGADLGLTGITPLSGGGLTGGATTLALSTCPSGQVLKSNGTGWACAADTVGTGDMTGVLTNAGSGLVGGATSGDATLALASCPSGEVLKSNGSGWACATDTGITGVTARADGGLAGTASALGLISCAAGEVLKSTGSGNWACQADSSNSGDITSVNTPAFGGLIGGATNGDVHLELRPCGVNQVLKFTSGVWACADDVTNTGDITGVLTASTGGLTGSATSGDATLSLMDCAAGLVLKSNGPGDWSCQADQNAGGDITGITTGTNSGLVGGVASGNATMALRTCAPGEILKYSVFPVAGWLCATDTTNSGDMTGVITPAAGGLTGGSTSGDATISLSSCPAGQVLKSSAPGTWACAADATNPGDITGIITATGSGLAGGAASGDSTLTLAPCALNQFLRFDGTNWACADDVAYTAGSGLTLTGSAFAANFTSIGSDTGSATTVARGDHLHDARYALRPQRTIFVRGGGTPAQNGQALVDAIASITTSSATDPWLIKLEPGEFDMAGQRYVGKPFVDLEGSGRTVTIVRSASGLAAVEMVGQSEVRELTVALSNSGFGGGWGLWLRPTTNATTSARRVNVSALGGTVETYAIVAETAAATPAFVLVEDATLNATANGQTGGGVRISNPIQATFRNVQITAGGAASGMVMGISHAGTALTVENSSIIVQSANTTTSHGIRIPGTTPNPNIFVTQTDIRIINGSAASRGIECISGNLTVRGGRIQTFENGSHALGAYNSPATLRNVELISFDAFVIDLVNGPTGVHRVVVFEGCLIQSFTGPPIQLQAGNGGTTGIAVASSRIAATGASSITSGALKCVTSYNGSYDPLSAACN